MLLGPCVEAAAQRRRAAIQVKELIQDPDLGEGMGQGQRMEAPPGPARGIASRGLLQFSDGRGEAPPQDVGERLPLVRTSAE